MEPLATKWWRYIPERPWPAWLYLIDFVIFMVSVYYFVTLGGVTGFLIGIAVGLLALPVFVAWQWIRWRAEWGPRARARTK